MRRHYQSLNPLPTFKNFCENILKFSRPEIYQRKAIFRQLQVHLNKLQYLSASVCHEYIENASNTLPFTITIINTIEDLRKSELGYCSCL